MGSFGIDTLSYGLDFKYKLREEDKKVIIFELDEALSTYALNIILN